MLSATWGVSMPTQTKRADLNTIAPVCSPEPVTALATTYVQAASPVYQTGRSCSESLDNFGLVLAGQIKKPLPTLA